MTLMHDRRGREFLCLGVRSGGGDLEISSNIYAQFTIPTEITTAVNGNIGQIVVCVIV